jgi:hypothetical protein
MICRICVPWVGSLGRSGWQKRPLEQARRSNGYISDNAAADWSERPPSTGALRVLAVAEMETNRNVSNTAILMIVSPRDCPIALYTIPSLARLAKSSPCFQATVYCNGLSVQQIGQIAELLSGYTRIILKDNTEYLQSIRDTIKIGHFVPHPGTIGLRQGFYETAPEIWSRELVRLSADFVAIIDPDFEILDDEFVNVMLDEFARLPQLAFYSTDYSPDQEIFESYAQEQAKIVERWHTWFCIYRRTSLEKCHDFNFYEERDGRLPVKYDHSAMLQKILQHRYGYVGRSLSSAYHSQFLHYANFAQNRSLKGMKLRLYRAVRIAKHNGWAHKHHSTLIARIVRKLAAAGWRMFRLGRFDMERLRYAYEMETATEAPPQPSEACGIAPT